MRALLVAGIWAFVGTDGRSVPNPACVPRHLSCSSNVPRPVTDGALCVAKAVYPHANPQPTDDWIQSTLCLVFPTTYPAPTLPRCHHHLPLPEQVANGYGYCGRPERRPVLAVHLRA